MSPILREYGAEFILNPGLANLEYGEYGGGLRDVPGTMPEGHPDWIVDTSPGTFPS